MLNTGVGDRLGTVVTLVIMLVLADSVFCHKGKTVWRNPCGFRLKSQARKRYLLVDKEIPADGLRHPSSRPLRSVRSEFRTTYEQFGSEHVQREITTVYSAVKNVLKEEYKYDWLPSNQLDWYRNNVKCLDKRAKVRVLLPTLHVSLQNFSATFENLLMSSGHSYLSEHQELLYTRRHLLSQIFHQVNRLLCEVDTAIINLGLEQPESLAVEAAEDMIWDTRPDHTHGLMQDWVVLAAYQGFLNDWMVIVRRLVGKRSNEPCRTRHKKQRPHR